MVRMRLWYWRAFRTFAPERIGKAPGMDVSSWRLRPGRSGDHARGSSGSRPVMRPAARMIGYPLFVGRRGSSLPRGLPPIHFARYFVRVGAVLRVRSGNGPTRTCRIGRAASNANMVGVAQTVRAPGCGPGGRGFESRRSPFSPRSAGAAVPLVGWNSGFPGQLEWPPTGSAGRSGGQPDRQPGWKAGRSGGQPDRQPGWKGRAAPDRLRAKLRGRSICSGHGLRSRYRG